MTQYVVTGRDQGVPVPQDLSVIAGHAPGVPFTATLDTDVEARLIGAGLLAHYPPANTVTAQGTADASGRVLTSLASGSNEGEWLAPSGGSGSSGVVVRKFPFAFDTPNLLTGATVYTPTVGDILLDAWFGIDTAWNGTSPQGDFGQFVSHVGWLSEYIGTSDMTRDDLDIYGTPADGLSQPRQLAFSDAQAVNLVKNMLELDDVPPSIQELIFRVRQSSSGLGMFTSTNPVKVCVSQNGATTGSDPGSTQGAATLYLVTATPV